MVKSKLVVALCLALTLGLTGCGSDETAESETSVEETVESGAEAEVEATDAVDMGEYETDADGNIIETEATQQVKVAIGQVETEAVESVNFPIDEFKKYGKVVKTKDGYRILGTDGYYITESMINYDGNCFYFDEDGYLKDNVFVPAKNSNGEVITLYVQNYKYTYGLVTDAAGKTYYIDENLGRLEKTTQEVDGKTYYFDENGKSVSKKTYESKFVTEAVVEETVEGSEVDGEGAEVESGVEGAENAESTEETEAVVDEETEAEAE